MDSPLPLVHHGVWQPQAGALQEVWLEAGGPEDGSLVEREPWISLWWAIRCWSNRCFVLVIIVLANKLFLFGGPKQHIWFLFIDARWPDFVGRLLRNPRTLWQRILVPKKNREQRIVFCWLMMRCFILDLGSTKKIICASETKPWGESAILSSTLKDILLICCDYGQHFQDCFRYHDVIQVTKCMARADRECRRGLQWSSTSRVLLAFWCTTS